MKPVHSESMFFQRRRSIVAAGMAGLLYGLVGRSTHAQSFPARRPDVPYEPSPQHVVEKMLELASVASSDRVYDLGCGDGRIVITAAKKYGASGVGIDLDPQRIAEANDNASQAGVAHRVKFMVGDLFSSNFADATVVTLFLWPHVNRKLRPLLWQQLAPGTRVVSYIWDMGREWPPEKTVLVQDRKIHYWTIQERHKRLANQ